jgi:hypothetical protein
VSVIIKRIDKFLMGLTPGGNSFLCGGGANLKVKKTTQMYWRCLAHLFEKKQDVKSNLFSMRMKMKSTFLNGEL